MKVTYINIVAGLAVALEIVSAKALGSERGHYRFFFTPDDSTKAFSVCLEAVDQGADPPFQDVGSWRGLKNPYGSEVAGDFEVYANRLSLQMLSSERDVPPYYGWSLTAVLRGGDFTRAHDAHFTILTAPEPANEKARPDLLSPSDSIVTTGSFYVVKGCFKDGE